MLIQMQHVDHPHALHVWVLSSLACLHGFDSLLLCTCRDWETVGPQRLQSLTCATCAMADLEVDLELEINNNQTNSTCCGFEKARIYLITFIVFYIACLSLSLLVYIFYWLSSRKKKVPGLKMPTYKCTNYCFKEKTFRGIMRQLKSGDTIPGKILISVTILCNLAYIALAIYRSLPPLQVEERVRISDAEIILELILVCELLLFSLVRFLASKNIILYWFDPYTIIDVCTLSHIFITIALGVDWTGLRFLRFAWLIQIITVLQFTRLLRSQNALDLIQLFIYFLVLWLSSSGILYVIEAGGDFWREVSNASPHSVLTYIYLTMVTMSTVGYGDVSPVTDLGKGFMIVFIIGGLAFFAAILPELVDLITRYYASSQYARFDTSRVPRHVIVCGHVTATSAEDFLKDFLHPDRGDKQTHVLFLHPERPDQDLKNVLRTYYTRVQFLLGSVLKARDLNKAKILNSSAIFIIANKHTENPKDEDHANMLRVVSVKNTTDKVPVIIQLVHSFSKSKVTKLQGWSLRRDIVVSINELKLGLLGLSCLCPGLSTLVGNLFYTINVEKISFIEAEHDTWKRRYTQGLTNELYSVAFSEAFDGSTFHEAARICFNKLNLVLLAVENVESGVCSYYINPSPKFHPTLRINSKTMLGYFIAEDQKQVFDVSVYCECCDDNRHVTSLQAVRIFKRQLMMSRWKTTLNFDDMENGLTLQNFSATAAVGEEERGLVTQISSGDIHVPVLKSENQEEIDLGEKVVETSVATEQKVAVVTSDEANSGLMSNSPSFDDDYEGYDDDEEEEEDEEDELTSVGKSRMHICDPVLMEDAILNPSLLLSVGQSSIRQTGPRPSRLKGHIILCLFARAISPLLGLYNFLKPLRSRHLPLQSIKPVVIICDRAFVEKEWPNICRFPQVYLVTGSPLLWKNLKAANVKNCSVCVVLTVHHLSSGHEQAIDDKEAILCTLSIKKHLKNIKKKITVITDLRQESNVQFLDFGDDDQPDERVFVSQPYACGEAFSVSMFDSVTSSAFHNPGTISLVEGLIHCSEKEEDCHVVPVPIRDTEFSNRTYKDFYNAQLKKFNICLGISSELPNSNGHSYYVASCPAKNLVLKETDIAFMLSTSRL